MKRGSILQEDKVIFNVCAPNNSVKVCKAKLQNCKEKYMSLLFLVGHLKLCLSKMDRYNSEKISKDTVELNTIINQLGVTELWYWRRLLRVPWTARRSNQSILKEISPGCSLEGLMLKLWPPDAKS